ncbi:MAG: Uncharacterised protein [Acidimicrobiales bacterium AG-410-I20]|nr:MAG: Uncharacterised protein [Acidimicrobiales bacterium AG-410-I20]
MPRMEIELTSKQSDGSWTWRAAGAKLPKGSLDGNLLTESSSVGDIIRVETEQFVDGISVVSVLSTREKKSSPELLEVVGSGKDEPLVTTSLNKKKQRRGKPRSQKGPRNSGGPKNRERSTQKKPRRNRTPSPISTGKRLKQKHVHRDAAIAALPEEVHFLAEQLSQKGISGLRSLIEEQNKIAASSNEPPIPAELLLKIAERIQPQLRTADWRDRAEAALKGIQSVDLRDLRSVVVASDAAAKDPDTRDLAEKLKKELTGRIENEHTKWVSEIEAALKEDRVVRALRMSSYPPKAGAPLPEEILLALIEGANANLTDETYQDRWITVLDALSLSPVRERVTPQSLPESPGKELLDAVTELSMKIPSIAALFGIKPTQPPKKSRSKEKTSA